MSLLQDQELWSQMKQMMLSLKPTRPSLRSGIHELQAPPTVLEFMNPASQRWTRWFEGKYHLLHLGPEFLILKQTHEK